MLCSITEQIDMCSDACCVRACVRACVCVCVTKMHKVPIQYTYPLNRRFKDNLSYDLIGDTGINW